MNIAPWTNIVEFGQKNDLQDLGFGTYYNNCGLEDKPKMLRGKYF